MLIGSISGTKLCGAFKGMAEMVNIRLKLKKIKLHKKPINIVGFFIASTIKIIDVPQIITKIGMDKLIAGIAFKTKSLSCFPFLASIELKKYGKLKSIIMNKIIPIPKKSLKLFILKLLCQVDCKRLKFNIIGSKNKELPLK